MGKTEGRNRSQRTAADLIKRGYPHGRRASRPVANSGGLTMVNAVGSSKFQRYVERANERNRPDPKSRGRR